MESVKKSKQASVEGRKILENRQLRSALMPSPSPRPTGVHGARRRVLSTMRHRKLYYEGKAKSKAIHITLPTQSPHNVQRRSQLRKVRGVLVQGSKVYDQCIGPMAYPGVGRDCGG